MRIDTATSTAVGAEASVFGIEPAAPIAVPVIGVVGSSGKSTVIALLRTMLRASGLRVSTHRDPLRDRPDRRTSRDRVVAEIDAAAPAAFDGLDVLIVTGLVSDELPAGTRVADVADRIRSLAHGATGAVVVNAEDAQALSAIAGTRAAVRRVALGDRSVDATIVDGELVVLADGMPWRAGRLDETSLAGGAFPIDLLLAAAGAVAAGARIADIRRAVRLAAPPVDHFETLFCANGVTWVCDAAATRPGQTAAMIDRAVTPLILIAGGRSGTASLARWASTVAAHAAHVLLYGSAAPGMAQALIGAGALDKIVRCADLDDATTVARKLAVPGDTVLFSPACGPEGDNAPAGRFRARALAMQPREVAA